MTGTGEAGEKMVDQLLAELYGGDPADFVTRRNALVRQLRSEGRAGLAPQIAGARRPTVSLWAANHLAEFSPAVLEALLQSGRSLREAQVAVLEGEAVTDLRALLAAHSAALQRAVDAATGFLSSRDREVPDAVRQRLQTTLRAVSLGPPELGQALAAGRLTAEQEPEGFGGFEGVVVRAPGPAPQAAMPRPVPESPRSGRLRHRNLRCSLGLRQPAVRRTRRRASRGRSRLKPKSWQSERSSWRNRPTAPPARPPKRSNGRPPRWSRPSV
ncbi:MAG: hypothetical protein ACR2MZ_10655 [Candidatus Dormibacter sp.]|uniref:hypothetical protein n=1 Tax=Candidatus Dormibacter sp. TaxID=2973982 RepID=UPI000DB434FC|nr:MAG: hypothetical protein DLM66_14750 [Candidatus Dormibacteraeota bacterium]